MNSLALFANSICVTWLSCVLSHIWSSYMTLQCSWNFLWVNPYHWTLTNFNSVRNSDYLRATLITSEHSVVYYYANLACITYCEVIFGFCREFYDLILCLGIFWEARNSNQCHSSVHVQSRKNLSSVPSDIQHGTQNYIPIYCTPMVDTASRSQNCSQQKRSL